MLYQNYHKVLSRKNTCRSHYEWEKIDSNEKFTKSHFLFYWQQYTRKMQTERSHTSLVSRIFIVELSMCKRCTKTTSCWRMKRNHN